MISRHVRVKIRYRARSMGSAMKGGPRRRGAGAILEMRW